MRRPVLAAIVSAAFLAAPAHAAPPPDLDAYVAQAMKEFGAPGFTLAIVEDGKTVVTKGYGVRDITKPDPVNEATIFPIGSESKAFTAAALAILVDRGKLKWSDRVVDRLPGFKMYDPYVTAHMTVKDLLTHRSGLGLGEGDLLIVPTTNRSRADVVHALRYLKPATGFRESYAYDNILYIVAGQLLEAVSGQSWEDFVVQNIFKPVGMNDTQPTYDANFTNGVALHARIDGTMRGMGELTKVKSGLEPHVSAPAGAINASARDMAKWMTVLLNGGKLDNGERLFSEDSMKEMWTGVTLINPSPFPGPMAPASPTFQSYALGWSIEDYHGQKIVSHTGGVLGAIAALYLIPGKKTGIAIMVNSEDNGARRAVLFRLMDYYLGLPQTDWIDAMQKTRSMMVDAALGALKSLPKEMQPNDHSSLPLSAYAGTYRDPWYGAMTVADRGQGKLWITFDRTPGMEGELEHVADDTFRTRWTDHGIEDAYVSFTVKGKRITGASMRAISPLADFSFDYQDLAFTPAGKQVH